MQPSIYSEWFRIRDNTNVKRYKHIASVYLIRNTGDINQQKFMFKFLTTKFYRRRLVRMIIFAKSKILVGVTVPSYYIFINEFFLRCDILPWKWFCCNHKSLITFGNRFIKIAIWKCLTHSLRWWRETFGHINNNIIFYNIL